MYFRMAVSFFISVLLFACSSSVQERTHVETEAESNETIVISIPSELEGDGKVILTTQKSSTEKEFDVEKDRILYFQKPDSHLMYITIVVYTGEDTVEYLWMIPHLSGRRFNLKIIDSIPHLNIVHSGTVEQPSSIRRTKTMKEEQS